MTTTLQCSQLFVCTRVRRAFVVGLCLLLPSMVSAQSLPSGWATADVGTPAVQGAAAFDNGRFAVRGAGTDIWGRSDEFMFVYRQLNGDGAIVARVTSVDNTHPWAKAGVMIRESLAADSRHVLAAVSAANGRAFQGRLVAGGLSTYSSGESGSAPVWLKLERRGAILRAFQSEDGVTWTALGTEVISMPEAIYVGLAVTGRNVNTGANARFSNVAVTPAARAPRVAPPSGWTARDVGNPREAGSTNYDIETGTYAVTGAGWDVRSDSDEFQYMYRQADGDVDVVARVTAVEHADAGTKAGVMMRDAPTANAAHVSMFVTAGKGLVFQRRATPGGQSQQSGAGTMRAPYWVKLERRGQRVTAFHSQDGTAWVRAGTATLSLPTVYIGIAVTSHNASVTATAVFDKVAVRKPSGTNQSPTSSDSQPPSSGNDAEMMVAQDNGDATVTAEVVATALPVGWATRAIGNPQVKGWAQYNAGTFSVRGGGADIWSTSDQFRYAYRSVAGDIDIVSRVVSVQQADIWSKAGVMIRESLAANAAHASVFVTPGRDISFQRRPTTGAQSQYTNSATSAPPYWVKLERRGGVITAFSSPDGTTWNSAGSVTLMTGAIYVGLAVTARNVSAGSTAVFDNVVVGPPGSNQPPTASLTSPADQASFTAPATVNLAATATDADGTVARVDFYSGTTLIGTDTTAPYAYSWTGVPVGTYTLKAVATDNNGATGTSATRTITVQSPSNQPPSVALTAPADGATFTAPATISISATASDADGTVAGVDFYAGTTLLGTDTSTPYSFTWNNVAAGNYSLTARARDNAGASTTSAARNVVVNPQGGTLPPGWSSSDIGNPQVAGSAQVNGSTFSIRGGGADIWGTSDQFHYAYGLVNGDVDIVSRVASIEQADIWSKAGVMIRQSLAANSAHASVFVTPGRDISFQGRPTTGADSLYTNSATSDPPYWVRLQRRGGTITAASSPNGSTWNTAGSITLATGTIYVGLAVTARNASAAATGQFDNVAVTPVSGPNQPPTVSLTAPANGASYIAPASVTISANASDTDGTVASVDFFAGTTLIGTDTTSPYSVTWNNVQAGNYSLTAVARDNNGAATTSAARSITVTSSLPRPTRAVFVASSNHSTAVDRYVLRIYTSGSNPDTATPVATQDLGKPPVSSNGECDVDISSTAQSLSPGTYFATVTAVGPGGSASSAPSAPFTR